MTHGRLCMIAGGCLLALTAGASAPPTSKPATQPAKSMARVIAGLRSPDPNLREAAASLLAFAAMSGRNIEAAVPSLLETLQDAEPKVRRTAAWALGRCGDRRAVGRLITLLKDEDASVQAAAAGALGEIGDPQASGALLAAVNDADGRVRAAAAKAVADLRGPPRRRGLGQAPEPRGREGPDPARAGDGKGWRPPRGR